MNDEPSGSAESRGERALSRTERQLVKDVFFEALNENTKPPEIRPALALGQFAALLSKVASTAKRQTCWIIVLTIVLVVLTGVIAWLTFVLINIEKHPGTESQAQSLSKKTQIQTK